MSRENENNKVVLEGKITENFKKNHVLHGEGFYKAHMSILRDSGTEDVVPIIVSDRLVDVSADWIWRDVRVCGEFRSYNYHGEAGLRLILFVFVQEFEEVDADSAWIQRNSVFLDGFICKPPIYRRTPLGREICDFLLAVNRPYGKSDYIPCLSWGRNARFAQGLEVGTRLRVDGRFQSREYVKKISEGESEVRVAYEASISKLGVVNDGESKD